MAPLRFFAPTSLRSYCYADICRGDRDWTRYLISAPVYVCAGGCNTRREFEAIVLIRPALVRHQDPRRAARPTPTTTARRPTHHRLKEDPASIRGLARPRCGCCLSVCLVRAGALKRTCTCEPDSARCTICTRGICHCRCRINQPSIN